MNRIFVLIALVVTSNAFAGIEQAPPNFPYKEGQAIFVDFDRASYRLVYDLKAKTVVVESQIDFEAPVNGYPIFDLVANPTNVQLDDQPTIAPEISDPDSISRFRVLGVSVSPGRHRLTLSHVLSKNVTYRDGGVASAFWMSDLDDRQYLEQYLPSNFEFDSYAMTMRIEIQSSPTVAHELRANGAVKVLASNLFEVEFPSFYTASSVFFHLLPKGSIPSTAFNFKSVDGRSLPVEIYSRSNLDPYVTEVKKVLVELEKDYGAFPHAKVVVYGAGSGGMEYSGATMTELFAVGHELFHSYNARAVMPAQGNSGWIDEAMSSWRDHNYRTRSGPGATTKMAGHSVWTRMTDDDAYTKGAAFLEWVAGRMAEKGKDFKVFLREYFKANFYQTMTTPQLKVAMESFSGLDLGADFDRYVYGKVRGGTAPRGSTWGRKKLELNRTPVENPFHKRLTDEQLKQLL